MDLAAKRASRLAALAVSLAFCGLAGAAASAPPASESHPTAATILWCVAGPDLRAADCRLPDPQADASRDQEEALRQIALHPPRLEGLKPGDHAEVILRLRYDWPLRDALDPGRPSRLFTVQQRIWLAAPPADITTRYYPERAQRMGQ